MTSVFGLFLATENTEKKRTGPKEVLHDMR